MELWLLIIIFLSIRAILKAWRDISKFRPGWTWLPIWGDDNPGNPPFDTWHAMDGLLSSEFLIALILFPFLTWKGIISMNFFNSYFYFKLFICLTGGWLFHYQVFIWCYHVLFMKKGYREVKRVLKGYSPEYWF